MKQIILLFLLTAFVASCSSTTSPGPNPTTRPGVGSSFVIRLHTYDTAGRIIYQRTDTITAIASGASYAGKSNVVTFKRSSGGNLSYMNYESNGDMSIYVDGHGRAGHKSGWTLIPIISKGSSSFVEYDTSYVSDGINIHGTATHSLTFAGEQTISAAGENFVTEAITINSSETSENLRQNYFEMDYFAPRIGYLVKGVSDLIQPDGRGASYDQTDLISYSLK